MTDTALNDVHSRENGTSLNHKNVIQMGIHATTLLSHVQAEMSQRHRNNIKSIVESQYVSPCGPKPGSKAAMQKPKNTDLEHLFGDDLKKAAKKAKTSNDMFKNSIVVTPQNLFLDLEDHKIRIFCTMATKLHQRIRKTEGSTTRTAVQITRPRTSIYQGKRNRNIPSTKFP